MDQEDTFGIGRAVDEMRDGKRVARQGWNGKGMFLFLHEVNDASVMTMNYVAIRAVGDVIIPWTCSQSDLLAEDWMVVP